MNTGVYKILNTDTNQFYIGSASKSFNQRWNNHKKTLRNGTHRNILLQRSFDKYGESSFSFSVLSYCPPEVCIRIEQWYIDKTNPYYNINRVAGSRRGAVLSEETKEKIRQKHIGKKLSKEHVESVIKATAAAKAGKTYRLSDETKRKISEAHKGKKIPYAKRSGWSEESKKRRSEERKGVPLSPLMEINRRKALLGKRHSEERCAKSRETHSKFRYKILTPTGEIKEATSLVFFAKENGLGAANNALANTYRGHDCRGWKTEYFKGFKVLSKEPIIKL